MQRSLMLVTTPNTHIGYDNTAKISTRTYQRGKTLREAGKAFGLLHHAQFDAWVRPGGDVSA